MIWQLVSVVVAMHSLTIQKNRFVDSNGEVFIAKGLDYQPVDTKGQYSDVISNDVDIWIEDVEHFKDLGVNVLRIYETDPDKDHSKFMQQLDDAGIYVVFDLFSQKVSVDRDNPQYTVDMMQYYQKKIDNLGQYVNTIGFIVGNEVGNKPGNCTIADAYVKAVIRDMKQYQKQSGKRYIPLGYAAADDRKILTSEFTYLACGDDGVDFYGLNSYSFCGDANLQTSGYGDLLTVFQGTGIPVFMTEYGCNAVQPRVFDEVNTLYGSDMLQVFSGGFAYEFTQNVNNYGLVKKTSTAVQPLQDYKNLKNKLAGVVMPNVQIQDKAKNVQCPPANQDFQASTSLPPTPESHVCQCLMDAATCVAVSLDPQKQSDLLNQVCGKVDCSETGASSGSYGAFSYCSLTQKLLYALSAYNQKYQSCNWDGQADKVDSKLGGIQECHLMAVSDASTLISSCVSWLIVVLMVKHIT